MELEVWGQTDVGLKREINQDSILVDQKLSLFIVADGMGGHRGGEVASALAVETMQQIFEDQLSQSSLVSPRDLLARSYKEASRKIFSKAHRENTELMGMGTTMVSAFAYENKIYFANVGDSRAYLCKEGGVWQITEDHSLVNEQIRAGILDPENPDQSIGRNVITRSVGFEEEVFVDIFEREMTKGEMYLLCSDGFCGLVSGAEIVRLCGQRDVQTIVRQAIESAKKAGGDDNISVILIKVL